MQQSVRAVRPAHRHLHLQDDIMPNLLSTARAAGAADDTCIRLIGPQYSTRAVSRLPVTQCCPQNMHTVRPSSLRAASVAAAPHPQYLLKLTCYRENASRSSHPQYLLQYLLQYQLQGEC